MNVLVDICVVPMGVGVSVSEYVVACQRIFEAAELSHEMHSYGTNVDPASGLASLMGYPGEAPHLCGNAYPDPVAGLFAASTIMTALWHQRKTGQGQYIDLSQAEATTALLGLPMLAFVPGHERRRDVVTPDPDPHAVQASAHPPAALPRH